MDLKLKSTDMTVNNLLQLKFDADFQSFLQQPKSLLSIPDYQREYKWDKSKIRTFATDIFKKSKFLGIISTEVTASQDLSIIDGQQRLTTIILILAELYNTCADEEETETQAEIESIISCQMSGSKYIRLKNESVGDYLHFVRADDGKSKLELEIYPENDIYRQAGKFEEACETIRQTLSKFRLENPGTTLDVYKQQLLDCELLLFAQKNTANYQQGSSEEIYIDINEKSQSLDPEDIFKGHCFAICKHPKQQAEVKQLWRSIKQNYFAMGHILKSIDMDIFLHYYLLTQEAIKSRRQDIKKDLTINGENVVTSYYNTPTKVLRLLKDMKRYQTNLLSFTYKLSIIDNSLSEVMNATVQELGNYRSALREINTILSEVISCNQNLFKLPLFYLIDQKSLAALSEKLTYKQMSAFTYLYYFYLLLFSRPGGSKKRSDLANNLIRKICVNEGYLIQFVKEILDYSASVNPISKINDTNTRKHLYTILDYFSASSTVMPAAQDKDLQLKLSLFPSTYNQEHLIINQSHKINWESADGTKFEFSTPDFAPCPAWTARNDQWANFIWLDATFNREQLKNSDVITKLIKIRGSYSAGNPPAAGTYAKKHTHIEVICQRIMKTVGFPELATAYSSNASRATVLNCYRFFINNYFGEENIDILVAEITNKYDAVLTNLKELVQ